MKRLISVAVLCLPLLSLAGCTANPATGKQSFTGFMSPADEIEIGRREHPKVLESFGGKYDDPKLDAYVRRVATALAEVTEVPGMPYTVTVLNDDKVNAFALPGGYVYITRGLLAIVENEAELAGVLAHEIGHITARHSAQRFSNVQTANIGLALIGILGGSSAPGVDNLVSLYAQIALQSYSREQEMEADMLSARYLTRAGYSPAAMISFLHKMQAHTELEAALSDNPELAKRAGGIMSTHPRTADRITQAIELAKTAPRTDLRLEREILLHYIDGLLFGDDPKQGIRKGRVFSHPEMGFRFEVPPGFIMFNSPDKLLARGPDGAIIVFDMEDPERAGRFGDLLIYLRNSWGEGLSLNGVERIEVNGMEAATGHGRLRMRDGAIKDIRLVAIREARDRIYHFVFLTPPAFTRRHEAAFRRATYSFKRLTANEVAAIKPLRVKVVTAGKNDTPASLASGMPFERGGLEWFELINGLRRGQPLIPGEKVKIITD